MRKKKINKNNTLDVLNKINVLNKRIKKQRKKVINNLKTSLESFNDSVLKKESESLDKLERERKFLETRFNKTNADGKRRDLGDLANNRPVSVERILNNDWNNMIRCNEIAQGSPLTEEEKAVKQKTDSGYNTQCPESANPNYEDN